MPPRGQGGEALRFYRTVTVALVASFVNVLFEKNLKLYVRNQ